MGVHRIVVGRVSVDVGGMKLIEQGTRLERREGFSFCFFILSSVTGGRDRADILLTQEHKPAAPWIHSTHGQSKVSPSVRTQCAY